MALFVLGLHQPDNALQFLLGHPRLVGDLVSAGKMDITSRGRRVEALRRSNCFPDKLLAYYSIL